MKPQAWLNAVIDRLRAVDGFERLTLLDAAALPGGALHQHWRLELEFFDWYRNDRRTLIIRRVVPPALEISLSLAEEAAILEVARAAGVMAPRALTQIADPSDGAPLLVLSALPGEADALKLVADEIIDRSRFAARLGHELAKLHGVDQRMEIPGWSVPIVSAGVAERLAELHGLMAPLRDPPAGLEAAIDWLAGNAPGRFVQVLRHGDFRLGNILVERGRVTGILDWEFAGWGAAMEDIGWLTARCWRFGQDDRMIGGIGELADFRAAYDEGVKTAVKWTDLPYWQIMATVRWAIIAACQGRRAELGGEPVEELRLTGLKAWEITHDALRQILELDSTAKPDLTDPLAAVTNRLSKLNPDYLETGRFSQPR